MKKKILFAASEAVPFIKTGGLADVIGSLPFEFNKDEYDIRVVLPKYTFISEEYTKDMKYLLNFTMQLNWRMQYVGVFELTYNGITFYFIDNEYYFGGVQPYNNMHEDIEKFAYFSKVVLDMLPHINFQPNIIHCNDWQTGLVPVFLEAQFNNNNYYNNIKTIMTIHNLRFQGSWGIEQVKDITGLPDSYFTSDKLEAYGSSSYLKGGIVYADLITTVSDTYANEIKTELYGEGLDGLMRARSNSIIGILNGIDYNEYNPETDPLISNYNINDVEDAKIKNKLLLQKELGIAVDKNKYMIGLVSRLTDQKGLDLVSEVIEDICTEDVQLIILGTGDSKYEELFRDYQKKYPDRVSANIYFSNELSHKIYAGCDSFLMPSLFEPCGLSQLISLRYGTLPIVRETGGLKDTVIPYNEYTGEGTGFSFKNYNAYEMLSIINYSKKIFKINNEWNQIIKNAMSADFSWKNSANKYAEIYNKL